MNPWWNLPFAVLALLALWCRVGAPERLIAAVGAVLGFFGVSRTGASDRQSAADLFGIAGMSGLLFVAWGDRIAIVPDAWLLVDAVATSLGLGLVGAWILARLGPDHGDPGQIARETTSREMTMMEVEELPSRPIPGGPGPYPR